jgi:hypothetical protein
MTNPTNLSSALASAAFSGPRADASPAPVASSAQTPAPSSNTLVAATPADFQIPMGALRLGDELGLLPPKIRAKYISIVEAAEDAFALSRPASEARDRLLEQSRDVQSRLDRLTKNSSQFSRPDPVAVEQLERELATLKEEIARAQKRYDHAAAKWRPLNTTRSAIEAFVRKGQSFTDAAEIPRDPKAETLKGLDAQRAKIRELKENRLAILHAQHPAAMGKAMIARELDRVLEYTRPNVEMVLETDDPLTFPTDAHRVNLLMHVFRPQIEAWLCEQIDAAADPASALSPLERREKLKAIDAEILAAERVEEAIYMAVTAAGHYAERRFDADPRAILNLL